MSFACKRLQEIRAFDFGHTNKQPKQSNTKPFSVSERSADGDNKNNMSAPKRRRDVIHPHIGLNQS